jgi:hypothetical protein
MYLSKTEVGNGMLYVSNLPGKTVVRRVDDLQHVGYQAWIGRYQIGNFRGGGIA